jgi:hypothetical protein
MPCPLDGESCQTMYSGEVTMMRWQESTRDRGGPRATSH